MKKTGDAIRRIAAILLMAVSGLLILLSVKESIRENEFVVYTSRSERPEIPQVTPLGQDMLFNSSSQEELMEMPGIGEVYADRIIQYREENGLFYLPEDLMTVKGIGEKRFAAIMEWLDAAENTPSDAQTEP